MLKKINDYTMLFWANQGNHNASTSVKFLPDFSPAELRAAAEQASKNGAVLGSPTGLAKELQEPDTRLALIPAFEPMLTNKNPANGQDPLEASSNNFYSGVTLKDLVGFTEHYGLNSRLTKQDGKLVEDVYRTGTPDQTVPPGLYARELGLAIRNLQQALRYSPPQQTKVINGSRSGTTRPASAPTGFGAAWTG